MQPSSGSYAQSIPAHKPEGKMQTTGKKKKKKKKSGGSGARFALVWRGQQQSGLRTPSRVLVV